MATKCVYSIYSLVLLAANEHLTFTCRLKWHVAKHHFTTNINKYKNRNRKVHDSITRYTARLLTHKNINGHDSKGIL